MLDEKVPDEKLTDYQRRRLHELTGNTGGRIIGSLDGMPVVTLPAKGAFAVSPHLPERRRRQRKELLRVTRVERDLIG